MRYRLSIVVARTNVSNFSINDCNSPNVLPEVSDSIFSGTVFIEMQKGAYETEKEVVF